MSNSTFSSSFTFTVPPTMLIGSMPKSRCFRIDVPRYRPSRWATENVVGPCHAVNGQAAGDCPSVGAHGFNCRRREFDVRIPGAIQDVRAQHASLHFGPLAGGHAGIEDLDLRIVF